MSVNCGSSGGTGAGGKGGKGGNGGLAGSAGGAAGGSLDASADSSPGGQTGNTGGLGGGLLDGGAGAAGSVMDGGTSAVFAYTFDTSTQGFALATGPGSGNLANIEGGTPATLGWDGTEGNPANGSLKVTATFTDFDQYAVPMINISPPIDATGKTVHVLVKLDSGAFTGGAQIQVHSLGATSIAASASTTLGASWTELTFSLAATPTFDPSALDQIGVQFSSGSASGPGSYTPVNAVFHIDSITDGSGGTPPPLLSNTFDRTSEGYGLGTSPNFPPDGGVVPTLTFDSTTGNPTAGSLEATAEFTGYNQSVDVVVNVSPPANLTGKIIHAKIRLDSGTLPSGYANLHASSGAGYLYGYPPPPYPLPTAGNWIDLTFDLGIAHTANPSFDPSQIVQVGVIFGTGDPPDGGAFPTPALLTFHIDSIIAQ